ncbi:hypothetical protein J3R30DRAFT_1760593 [Lentinula aciculospora]|uniref:Mid2 domain-containing protein n=1 Tax=Lentinula aciculospora TaxID=153920 RepID=A0A9W9AIJ1_9AGAR|nr:hypothetical protein J3R30DRAFT_1760593 [Lentinula aciculospora]
MFFPTFFAHCLLAFLYLNASHAFPLLNRQATATAQLSTPTTLTTVTSSMTPAGPLTQTCVITLTPITDSNGKPAVQEVKNCTVAVNANNASSTAAAASDSTSAAASSTSAAATSSTSVSADAAISVNGITTMSSLAPTTQTASASVSSASSSGAATSTASNSAAGSASVTSTSAATTSSATAAADNANPTSSGLATQQLAEATYVVPGKSLQVLPIGLGVFAGISALALIVVGLVTYERTKYRKAFRQRKLAEQGAAMVFINWLHAAL